MSADRSAGAEERSLALLMLGQVAERYARAATALEGEAAARVAAYRRARAAGCSWGEIGRAVGCSPEAAAKVVERADASDAKYLAARS